MVPDGTRIGFICPPEHEMFGPIASKLHDRGYDVTFLEPGVEVATDRLDDLDLLVNKKVRWASVHALEYAYRNRIPAWNDYVATTIFLNRLSQLLSLSVAGFSVPEVLSHEPEGTTSPRGSSTSTRSPR
ncbi:hypothetical protein VB779_23060 [Haloarculaceae archaeon H-GB11]|nr:hypothetical protein [Haloarculaceae archaeon H-GB11]